MKSLEDAWRWYEETSRLAKFGARLATRHWEDRPEAMLRDEHLKELQASDIVGWTETSRAWLDDLAVLILFSVFESVVRERIQAEVEAEAAGLVHPVLIDAAAAASEAVESGSIFRVLEPYKNRDADLVEQTNQIRRYRNWVAHGRRGEPQAQVIPKDAYSRLDAMLALIATSEAP